MKRFYNLRLSNIYNYLITMQLDEMLVKEIQFLVTINILFLHISMLTVLSIVDRNVAVNRFDNDE